MADTTRQRIITRIAGGFDVHEAEAPEIVGYVLDEFVRAADQDELEEMPARRSANFAARSEPDGRDVDHAKRVLFTPRSEPAIRK